MAGPWERYAGPVATARPSARPSRSQIQFADDADAVARTLLGEAGNQGEQGMLAVGGVIANRARQRGLTPSQVVLEKSQFEPWGNPETTARLLNVNPQSPEYQSARAIAERALAGEDITGGASHFYAPRAQAALGRPAPAWDNGSGRAIGDHLFFNLDGGQPAPVATPASDGPWSQYASSPTNEPVAPIVPPPPGTTVAPIKDGVWVQGTGGENDWQYMSRARADRMSDPEYQRAFAEAQRGSANVPDQLRALGLGASYGFLTDINAEAQRVIQGAENIGRRATGQEVRYGADDLAQATRDAMRDDQAAYAAENPLENFALQLAGGIVAPGAIQGGQYIGAAQGGAATARAAQVGAGMGLASGLGYGEGNLVERAPSAALSTVIGGATGAGAQMGINRLGRVGTNGAPRGSQARRLSREGVELTPGQMLGGIPAVGPVLRTLEEASSTIPFAGAAIADARDRSVNTFNRAALNRVLRPLEEVGLGETMPSGLRAQIARIGRGEANPQSGYEAVERVQNVVSKAYDRALDGVEISPDQQFYDDLAAATIEASENLPEQMTDQLARVLQNRVFRTLEFEDSVMTGKVFKDTESILSSLAREQRLGGNVENRAFANALDDTRGALRDLVSRQRPDRAPQIQAINRAYSNLVPIEEAAGSTASQAAEGVFTPTQLAMSASRSQSRRARAAGEGRMQDLTAPAKGTLTSRLGDSGTSTRGAVTALMSGAAGAGGIVAPGVAIPTVIGVSAAYSRPAQAALNAVYRATDSRVASEALRQLADQARRNPALLPYYEDAAQHVLGLSQRETPAMSPAPASAQAPSAALQRVLQ